MSAHVMGMPGQDRNNTQSIFEFGMFVSKELYLALINIRFVKSIVSVTALQRCCVIHLVSSSDIL